MLPFVPPWAREHGATHLLEAFQRGGDAERVQRAYAGLLHQGLEGNQRHASWILDVND